MPDLNKTFLYRMTHIENIPHVLEHGITHRHSPNHNPAFVPIGDGSLIDKRTEWPMPNQKRLGDYIPFYFGPRMPMLYVIQKGFSGVAAVSAEKIVYCITSVADVIDYPSISFMFTDGHAFSGLSSFYDAGHITDLEQIIDRKAIGSEYWNDPNDLDLKRRMEAEFLLLGDLPVSAIRGYAVYDEPAKTTLIKLGINQQRVVVRPRYYF